MNGRAAGECLSNGGQPERRDVASKPSREVLESKGEPGTPTKLWDLKVVSLPVSCEPTVCWDLVQLLRPSFCTMGQEGTLFWTSGRGKSLLETHSEGVSRENLGQAEHLG